MHDPLLRLDIWHFMRRLSNGCTTDAHPLYGTFMSHISKCIFKWEKEDLTKAKQTEMMQQHFPDQSDAEVWQKITAAELALHCRRVTRGVAETISLITKLIDALDGDAGLDPLGVPLSNSNRMHTIWEHQQKHVKCLQDPY